MDKILAFPVYIEIKGNASPLSLRDLDIGELERDMAQVQLLEVESLQRTYRQEGRRISQC